MALRNGGMERNEETNEWARAAVRRMWVRAMRRVAVGLATLAVLEEWE